MVDDKLARRSLWVGELACSSRAYHIFYKTKSLLALKVRWKGSGLAKVTNKKVSWQSG